MKKEKKIGSSQNRETVNGIMHGYNLIKEA